MQSQFVRNFLELRLPFPGHKCFLIEVVESAPIPKCATGDAKTFPVTPQRDRVGRIRLQFHGIGASAFGGLDNADSLVEVLVMVRGELGDHIDRSASTDRPPGYGQVSWHEARFRTPTQRRMPVDRRPGRFRRGESRSTQIDESMLHCRASRMHRRDRCHDYGPTFEWRALSTLCPNLLRDISVRPQRKLWPACCQNDHYEDQIALALLALPRKFLR